MRKRVAQLAVGLLAVVGVAFGLVSPASANVGSIPELIIYNSTAGGLVHPITVDVVLDGDGVYNVSTGRGDNFAPTGYDARLKSGSSTRDLGWTHTAGYDIPPGQCFSEVQIGVGPRGVVCAPVTLWRERLIADTHAWAIQQISD